MEYSYNLTEIREVIDKFLHKELDKSVNNPEKQWIKTAGTSNNQDTTESTKDLVGNCTSVLEGDQEGIEYWSIAESPLISSTPLQKTNPMDNNKLTVVEAGNHKMDKTDTDISAPMEKPPSGTGNAASDSFSNMDDFKLKSEDMSLKLVLTYFYYMDTSTEGSDDFVNETAEAEKTDKCKVVEVVDTETEKADSVNNLDSGKDNFYSEADFDADIDSLTESDNDSYRLTSFSMMNIFDSTCDQNHAFTGSLDFNQICRDPGSDSDKDTLDWLSESSDEESKYGERKTGITETSDSALHGNTNTNSLASSVCSGSKETDSVCELQETKRYSGSTYSISKCNSEIRHKLVKRLFRKVFPSKKYVVNRKK